MTRLGQVSTDNETTDIQDAENILSQMKISLIAITDKLVRERYIIKIKTYTNRLNKLRTVQTQHNRRDGLEILKQAHRQLIETEVEGISILTELERNKTTLQQVHKNMKIVKQDVHQSNHLVSRLGRWWRG